jgi:hypothetical protein
MQATEIGEVGVRRVTRAPASPFSRVPDVVPASAA